MKLKFYDTLKIIFLSVLITHTILCTKTESESKINIGEGFMKHRKSRSSAVSQNVNMLEKKSSMENSDRSAASASSSSSSSTAAQSTATTSQDTQSFGADSALMSSTNLGNVADKLASDPTDPNIMSPTDLEIGSGPVWATGWVKFFKYVPTSETKRLTPDTHPRQFVINGQFQEQLKLYPNFQKANEKTSDGTNVIDKYITDKHSFYAILLKDTLNILTSRMTDVQKTYDVVNIGGLADVTEIGGFPKGGGIEDFGNFSEGFCFKLNLIYPRSEVYVVCTRDIKNKTDFMMYIKKMKINLQRSEGKVLIPQLQRKGPETISGMLNPDQKVRNAVGGSSSLGGDPNNPNAGSGVGFDSSKQKITDGYWIVLQNWSQCTLKCGGGKSYLQRMCVPPKSGGKPCEGQSIIEKDCNKQPCPKVEANTFGTNNTTQVMKPIVKIMPFSSRPQRYTKCVIKEGDMMYTKDLNEKDQLTSNMGKKPDDINEVQVPVRAVLNNRTLTLFAGEDYDTHIISFNIMRSVIVVDKKNPESCFWVNEDNGKKARLCPFGCDNAKKAVDEWDYDFNLFKFQCNYGHQEQSVNFEKKLNEKIRQAKKALLDEAQEEMKKKAQDGEDKRLQTEVKQTNKVALQAIQKEINLEEMIKLEEAEREKREEEQMLKKIEDEKKKSECLMKAIKEKQLENQYNLRQKETEMAISNIKKAAAREVQIRRSNLKKLIEDMRKKQKRKTSTLSQQLQSVRYAMAETMGKAYKKGNLDNCILIGNGKEDGPGGSKDRADKRKHYCVANYSEDFVNYQTCLDGDDFCHMCCDNEFGEFYIGDRENCYAKSCTSEPVAEPQKDNKGRWIWQSEISD